MFEDLTDAELLEMQTVTKTAILRQISGGVSREQENGGGKFKTTETSLSDLKKTLSAVQKEINQRVEGTTGGLNVICGW